MHQRPLFPANDDDDANAKRLLRKNLNTAFPAQRIAGPRPANPERRNPALRPALLEQSGPKNPERRNTGLRPAFPEQSIAGLRPENPEGRNPGLRPAPLEQGRNCSSYGCSGGSGSAL